jgi:hypothetical protein
MRPRFLHALNSTPVPIILMAVLPAAASRHHRGGAPQSEA